MIEVLGGQVHPFIAMLLVAVLVMLSLAALAGLYVELTATEVQE